MSGRSAYVRKKITDTKSGGRSSESRRYSESDDISINDHGFPQGTGYGTTNARFLKFTEPSREIELANYRSYIINSGNPSSSSQSGGSESGRKDGGSNNSQPHQGPMPDFAYARTRKPVLRTEDVSGIERSGFRSAVDKKSDEFRKNLTKAFTFGARRKKLAENARSECSAATRSYNDSEFFDVHELPSTSIQTPQQLVWDPEYQQIVSPPPSVKLPPIPPPSTTPLIKRWISAGRPAQRWNKLRKDPELWDPNGDVLVFFGRRGQSPRPNPSFRLSSHIIEATESRFLITLLREGSTEDEYDPRVHVSQSPIGAPPMLRSHSTHPQLSYNLGRNGQPTPPVSEDTSLTDIDGQISYEMYFPTPPTMGKVEALRYAITTRNIFALLYHASPVGLSLSQALSDLLERLKAYMPTEADNLGTILNYLSARGIDDPRNDPETAVSLLAWSETPEVRWEEGWCEAFAHCTGMYSRLEACADFKFVTPVTRALLDRAYLETQLRVQAAEERLAEFSCEDIWPTTGPVARGSAKDTAERLRQFFISHYAKVHGYWPPPEAGARTAEGEETWLSRTLARQMQKDFGALYDYLVNRDIVWDETEERSSRKWMMVSESGNKSFEADTPDLPLTDMLIQFDNRMRFPHIPHPYPLVPESIVLNNTSSASSSRERFKKDKNSSANNAKQASDDRNAERRAQFAYTEATNIYILGSDFKHSDLIESFVKFEKTDQVGALDPFVARRGRWVLIYCILQALASVSVDAPNIRYKDNVSYHLSPRFKDSKTPPWKHGASAPDAEAYHKLSHCWLAPWTWQQSGSGGESADSDGSTDSNMHSGDPVLRMMRAQAQKLPRPPRTVTSRSSNGGWYTPRSVLSPTNSVAIPAPLTPTTTWGGSDDTASSIIRPSSSAGYYQGQGQGRKSYASSRGARSERSYATFGPGSAGLGGGRLEEARQPPLHQQQGMSTGMSTSMSIQRTKAPAPLDLNLDVTQVDGFLDPSHSPSSVGGAHILSPNSSDGLGPVIRDFDELESVVEEDG
ncbi:uncharacterized protein F4812DRAFT_255161 [Daldinia caldariorum]|uniref:uncharacterized protein n=1 Tax=Daldinia caldariorum TaxID=326644 RepID=UPI002008D208|nr:uncharacterized protein F4812DRAFT_255161 [Daldinia caldariorum]KAI1463247.1 hypothetical protein F4812DRAFT_255161 [Daldinia caldariorum]